MSRTSFTWTPENSRRFRALSAWMTLQAYGKEGYREIVERCSGLAERMGTWIEDSPEFHLLAPVQMNGVCFTLSGEPTAEDIDAYLKRLSDEGEVFLTPTNLFGIPAIRSSISNWQTEKGDLERAWSAMQRALKPERIRDMSLFLDAANGADTPRAPIWIMRQAGRYLPEYRAIKEKSNFWEMCRTPELAAEITLQPIRRFGLDAAILFQDIMTPLAADGREH